MRVAGGAKGATHAPDALYGAAMSKPSLAAVCLWVLPAALSGCGKKIDKLSIKTVVARSLATPDVDMSCEIGVSLRHALAGLRPEDKPARKALLITETTAAMCDELRAWEVELERAQVMSSKLGLEPVQRATYARDLGYESDRLQQRAAARFMRAWELGNEEFGKVGSGDCPKLKKYDEFAYFLTLVAGTQAVLYDSRSGRTLGIPQETILDVARGAECIVGDNEGADFWFVPQALQGAAWATIPGSGPEGVDPWALLDEMGQKGDSTGIRVTRALQATIAMNAGREDIARSTIQAHAAALDAHDTEPTHALLDRYAYLMTRHQSDLLWYAEEGHRTPVFGELPGTDASPEGGEPDPFGADPFGGDPFGGDPTLDASPNASGEDAVPDSAPSTPDSPAQEPR